jgi:hypothetical protein
VATARRPALAVVSVQWGNPYREPPEDGPRILWACTVLDRAYEAEILAHADSVLKVLQLR